MEVGVVSNFYTRLMDGSDTLPIIVFYFFTLHFFFIHRAFRGKGRRRFWEMKDLAPTEMSSRKVDAGS